MGKGLPRSHSGVPKSHTVNKKIDMNGKVISVAGTAGVGFGSVVVEGLPEGNILLQGIALSLSFAGSGADANLVDTWSGDFALGTTPVDDGTATLGDIDLVALQAIGPATAEAIAAVRAISTPTEHGLIIDNTAGALEINLNLLIDDLDISGTVLITVGGFVALSYIVLGDD